MGHLTPMGLWRASKETVITTSTVMLIVMSASLINPFLALSHIPQVAGDFLTSLPLPPMGILILILLTYVVLGCFLDSLAMLVLTLPIFFPVIVNYGFDPIWFGVLIVLTLEMGLISPPVGMNVFIVKSVAKHVPLGTIFLGVVPFLIAMVITLAILIAFPQISLIIPNTMIN